MVTTEPKNYFAKIEFHLKKKMYIKKSLVDLPELTVFDELRCD
jgi:hypothetical protein